jgi:hypothetical protein
MDIDHLSLSQWVAHIVSGIATLGVLAGLWPFIFALPPFIYYCMQIYESKPFQRWMHRRKSRKIAKLEAELNRLKPKG